MNKPTNFSRRKFLSMAALVSAGLVVAPSHRLRAGRHRNPRCLRCLPRPPPGPLTAEEAGGMDALVAAANAEGELSTIALPDDWANYGEIKQASSPSIPASPPTTTSIPKAAPAQEIEAISANAGQHRSAEPGRDRRGLPVGQDRQGRRSAPALQGRHLGHASPTR